MVRALSLAATGLLALGCVGGGMSTRIPVHMIAQSLRLAFLQKV